MKQIQKFDGLKVGDDLLFVLREEVKNPNWDGYARDGYARIVDINYGKMMQANVFIGGHHHLGEVYLWNKWNKDEFDLFVLESEEEIPDWVLLEAL